MNTPLVSIIIPCYNAENYIAEAIESALGQTYENIEIIVVDDGSRDGSLGVIQGFGTRIVSKTGPNQGGCAARNTGLRMAQGEFVQFLDADDLLHPDKVQIQVERNANLGPTAISFSDAHSVDMHSGEFVRDYKPDIETDDSVILLLRYNVPTPSPLHRKSLLLEAGGFDESLPCSQEYDLHLRLACAGVSFVHTPRDLITVRRVAASVSGSHLRCLDEAGPLLTRTYENLLKAGSFSEERQRAFSGAMAKNGRFYFKYSEPQKARAAFHQAREMHPSGGLSLVYGGPLSVLMVRAIGPEKFEKLRTWFKREPTGEHYE